MGLQLGNITFDAGDPRRLAAFWSEVIGKPVDPPREADQSRMASINAAREGGPKYLFLAVPEAKTAKNRVHLDWYSPDRLREVDRLGGLGASVVGEYDEEGVRWTTLRDPEGNEFCVGGESRP